MNRHQRLGGGPGDREYVDVSPTKSGGQSSCWCRCMESAAFGLVPIRLSEFA